MMTIYMGIDWSREKHDVTVMNEAGGTVLTREIAHSARGFEEIDGIREGVGESCETCIIGIESAHTLLIDYLWARGYPELYVLPPGVIAANRSRNRQSGARDDRYDSWVIADTLRTDLVKFQPWKPGSELLQQMRVRAKYAERLTKERTRLANRLEDLLLRYYPAALQVFTSWPNQIICHFLLAYPTPEAAVALELAEFREFCRRHRYSRPKLVPACYARLQAAQPAPLPGLVAGYVEEVCQLAQTFLSTEQHRQDNLKQFNQLFAEHPDHRIFASLPGTGSWLAPALLVKFGEDRLRFPTADALQALAGTCPVTRQSGKSRSVHFRRSCDHSFRQIAQQWARCAAAESDWAASYRHQVFMHHRSHSHADRCLANRLLAIAWKLWQTNSLYDEETHLRNCAKRARPIR
jgi:transposase